MSFHPTLIVGNRFITTITITSSTQNISLDPSFVPGYTPGSTDLTLLINGGVYVGSSSTGSYALNVTAAWNTLDTITIINNGYIVGMGGIGGAGSVGANIGGYGGSGGPALGAYNSPIPVTVYNNGVIGGGGGGGGGGGAGLNYGNGGGGGQGYLGGPGGWAYVADDVAYGGNGSPTTPGAAGVVNGYQFGTAGAGGTLGSSGGQGTIETYCGGGCYPSWISSLYPNNGAAGAAVYGNSKINWAVLGTIYGGRS